MMCVGLAFDCSGMFGQLVIGRKTNHPPPLPTPLFLLLMSDSLVPSISLPSNHLVFYSYTWPISSRPHGPHSQSQSSLGHCGMQV